MDKEFLQKHNLWESHQNFMRLIKEGYLSSVIDEAGDEQPQDPNAMGGGAAPAPADPMGGGAPQGPDAMGGADGGAPQGQDAMGGQDPSGGMSPDPGMGAEDPGMEGGPEGPIGADVNLDGGNPEDLDDNQVIDVEDVVQAQEKLNDKENEVGKDVTSLAKQCTDILSALETMKQALDNQNARMTSLSDELEKRIPTQQERLQMQSLHSSPYNVDPNEYWNKKEGEGVYQASDEPRNQEPLEIKQKMIDNYSQADVEKSLENPSTKDIFKGFF